MRNSHPAMGLLLLSAISNAEPIKHTTDVPPVVVARAKPNHFTPSGALKTTISSDDIHLRGNATLGQLLQNSGAVQLRSITGDNSQASINIRGFGSNANSNSLLLINGIPLTNPDLAPPNLNTIPVEDIEYISIIPGSESVLYGDQAVGGVINITTLHTLNTSNAITCSGGSYRAYACNYMMSDQLTRLGYYFHLGVNHTDNYRDHNNYDQQAFSGQFNYRFSDTSTAVLNYMLDNELIEFPGALTLAQVRQNRRQANNDRDFFRDKNTLFHLIYTNTLNSNWKAELDLSRRELIGNGVLFSDFTQARESYLIKPIIYGEINKAHITLGGDAQSDDYQLSSLYGVNKNKQQKFSLFALGSYDINNKTQFNIGARGAEQLSRISSTFTNSFINRVFVTTLGLTYQINHDTQSYLRRAGSYRFPKADENVSAGTGINGLRTQRGVSYEAGIKSKYKQITGNANIYLLKLRDEITFDPTQTPQQPFGSNTNLPPTTRHGVSVSGKYRATQKLSLDGQINLVKALFSSGPNKNNRIPLVSEAIIHGGVDYHFTESWHLYTEALYTSNQYLANDNGNVALPAGGYTLFNANLGYQFHHLDIGLRINNIFNKPYYIYSVYQPSNDSESFYPAPERNVMLTVTWRQG